MGLRDYNGYELDVNKFSLLERDHKMLEAVLWLIDNKDSIRGASRNCLIPKSTLCEYINKELQKVSFEMYKVARAIIKTNKKRLCTRRLYKN